MLRPTSCQLPTVVLQVIMYFQESLDKYKPRGSKCEMPRFHKSMNWYAFSWTLWHWRARTCVSVTVWMAGFGRQSAGSVAHRTAAALSSVSCAALGKFAACSAVCVCQLPSPSLPHWRCRWLVCGRGRGTHSCQPKWCHFTSIFAVFCSQFRQQHVADNFRGVMIAEDNMIKE